MLFEYVVIYKKIFYFLIFNFYCWCIKRYHALFAFIISTLNAVKRTSCFFCELLEIITGLFERDLISIRRSLCQCPLGGLVKRNFEAIWISKTHNVLLTPACTFSRATCAPVNPVIKRFTARLETSATRVRVRKRKREREWIQGAVHNESGAFYARCERGDHRPGSFSASKRVSNWNGLAR